MAKFPYPSDPRLEGIVLAYTNGKMIADELSPRKTVSAKSFKYNKFDIADRMTLPDTKIGRKSYANQVEFGATEATESTEDYALEDVVPIDDINNAAEGFDPEGDAIEGIGDLLLLGREKRLADMVQDAANYHTDNKATLAATDQINAYATSDPLGLIEDIKNGMFMTPNVLVLNRLGWSKLRMHPQIVSAVLGNSGTKGIVSRQAVADLFELDKILVGEAWLNTAQKGQTPVKSRVWGKTAILAYQDKLANPRNRTTFTYTAQYGGKVASSEFNKRIGLNGANIVKAGESVKELIVANDLAYLITNFIA